MCLVCATKSELGWRRDPAFLKGFADEIRFPDDAFGEIMPRYADDITSIVRDFVEGRLSPVEFEEYMAEVLRSMHQNSNYAGQQMADYLPPSRTLANQRGRLVASAETQYLRGFAFALANKDPRYWLEESGEWRFEQIDARARSYMGRARGSATDGWGIASGGVNTLVNWVLGSKDPCEDCPVLAAQGPWLLYGSTGQFDYPTLGFLPGENRTDCMFYCQCRLARLSDGKQSPAPFEFETALAA